MKKYDPLRQKSLLLATKIVRFYTQESQKKYSNSVLLKQILRSATSVGANIREANGTQSTKDFIAKMHISLKEAKETQYWIELFRESKIFQEEMLNEFEELCVEIIKMLVSSLKTAKQKMN